MFGRWGSHRMVCREPLRWSVAICSTGVFSTSMRMSHSRMIPSSEKVASRLGRKGSKRTPSTERVWAVMELGCDSVTEVWNPRTRTRAHNETHNSKTSNARTNTECSPKHQDTHSCTPLGYTGIYMFIHTHTHTRTHTHTHIKTHTTHIHTHTHTHSNEHPFTHHSISFFR